MNVKTLNESLYPPSASSQALLLWPLAPTVLSTWSLQLIEIMWYLSFDAWLLPGYTMPSGLSILLLG